jgi:hypothetical protein
VISPQRPDLNQNQFFFIKFAGCRHDGYVEVLCAFAWISNECDVMSIPGSGTCSAGAGLPVAGLMILLSFLLMA